jgi:hypothetical protein
VAVALRPTGVWPVVALTAGAAVAVLILVPTVALLFPALGMTRGGAAALFAVMLGLAALPVVDLLHPQAGGQRAMAAVRARRGGAVPALAAALVTLVLTGVGLAVDRFDAAHPVPTHLIYALDADSGRARWVSTERDPQPWTRRYVSTTATIGAEFPVLGDREVRTGPAPVAALPAPQARVVADTTAAGVRTLRLRLAPQRPVRLVSLHVDAATAAVQRAVIAGREVPVARSGDGRWALALAFHAPPPDGVEVELAVRATAGGPVRLRVMDASDGLAGLPGFRPRPADVGVVGSHTSEMVAVGRTYTL